MLHCKMVIDFFVQCNMFREWPLGPRATISR